jgi:hypothetical protein
MKQRNRFKNQCRLREVKGINLTQLITYLHYNNYEIIYLPDDRHVVFFYYA